MSKGFDWRLALLLAVTAIILIAGIGLRDPWPADEPRFALIAKDMVEGGDWLLPHIGGVLYPDKPPVFFWLVAAFFTLTGSISVSLLIPGVIAGIGVMWLVTDLSRRLWDERTALWVGATLLVMIQFPYQMKNGQIDGLLCLWTTLGLYGMCRHLLTGPHWGWYAIAGLSCGFGVITKGVGFLPLLILLPFVLLKRRGWLVAELKLADWRWLAAPLAFALALGVWLVPMLLITSGSGDADLAAYRDNILLNQTVTRYVNSWGHLKPPWYLFTNAAPVLWFPVTLMLPWLVPAWLRDVRNRDTPIVLLGAWILLVLLFFSLSDGKRSLYIFPAAPAIAMIAGRHAQEILRRAGARRVLLAASILLAVILVAVGGYALERPDVLARWVSSELSLVAWFIVITAIAILVICGITRVRHATAGFAGALVITWICVSLVVNPAINDARSGKSIVDQISPMTPPGHALGFVDWPEQFLLQWNRPAVHFGYRRADKIGEGHDAATWVSRGLDRRVLLSERIIEPCFDKTKLVALGHAHRRNWYLARESSVLPDCRIADNAIEQIVFYHPPRQLALMISRTPASIYRQARVFN